MAEDVPHPVVVPFRADRRVVVDESVPLLEHADANGILDPRLDEVDQPRAISRGRNAQRFPEARQRGTGLLRLPEEHPRGLLRQEAEDRDILADADRRFDLVIEPCVGQRERPERTAIDLRLRRLGNPVAIGQRVGIEGADLLDQIIGEGEEVGEPLAEELGIVELDGDRGSDDRQRLHGGGHEALQPRRFLLAVEHKGRLAVGERREDLRLQCRHEPIRERFQLPASLFEALPVVLVGLDEDVLAEERQGHPPPVDEVIELIGGRLRPRHDREQRRSTGVTEEIERLRAVEDAVAGPVPGVSLIALVGEERVAERRAGNRQTPLVAGGHLPEHLAGLPGGPVGEAGRVGDRVGEGGELLEVGRGRGRGPGESFTDVRDPGDPLVAVLAERLKRLRRCQAVPAVDNELLQMVGGIANREDHPVADQADGEDEVELTELATNLVEIAVLDAGLILQYLSPGDEAAVDGQRHHLATGDRASLERVAEGGIGLREEFQQDLDPLDLRRRHLGLAGLEAPHEIGNDDLLSVVGERLEDHPSRQLLAAAGRVALKFLDLGHLPPNWHDLQAPIERRTFVVVIVVVVHLDPVELEPPVDLDPPRHATARHLEDGGCVLRLLDLLDQLQERDAGGLAVEKGVGRDHVAEELHRLLVLGELEIGVEHRQRAARLELLFFVLLEGLDHARELADCRDGIATENEIDLLLQPERRRNERRILGDHRHAPLERVGAAGGSHQRQAGKKRKAQPAADTARGLRSGGGMADKGHRGSFRWGRGRGSIRSGTPDLSSTRIWQTGPAGKPESAAEIPPPT